MLEGGILTEAWGHDGQVRGLDLVAGVAPPIDSGPGTHASDAGAAERGCVAAWLDRAGGAVRILHSSGVLASQWPGLPEFRARPPRPVAATDDRTTTPPHRTPDPIPAGPLVRTHR